MALPDEPLPCDQCEEVYGESRNWGGSHWHCANCGLISGYQGHWKGRFDNVTAETHWGFECPPRPGEVDV